MKAVPVNGKVKEDMFYDTYSRILLEKKHPVMRKYLVAQKKATETLKDHLLAKGGDRAAKRLWQVENELRDIEKALNYFNEMERPVDR